MCRQRLDEDCSIRGSRFDRQLTRLIVCHRLVQVIFAGCG
ncbi:hypothetical protein T11_8897 [Trichinella zimbabwensis]|uniref:Uncharacterized protein n=1 Tax=Trichinella zimbabwensis TaxID=268475 RepID=A0A0V1GKQ1_9BILA|nr:hypothetical protein T11_8897 [Trichinella zimbabwensis]